MQDRVDHLKEDRADCRGKDSRMLHHLGKEQSHLGNKQHHLLKEDHPKEDRQEDRAYRRVKVGQRVAGRVITK